MSELLTVKSRKIIDMERRLVDLELALKSDIRARRESSPELSSLAAKYLGMNEEDFLSEIDGMRGVSWIEVLTDIKRLAASVLSQDETKG